MSENSEFALVPKPPSAVEKAGSGAEFILSVMVADTLVAARRVLDDVENSKKDRREKYIAALRNSPSGKWAKIPPMISTVPATETPLTQALDDGETSYQQGIEFSKQGKHESAFYSFKRAAENGHWKARYALGWAYDYGRGVQQNNAEAVRWFRKAAEQIASTARWLHSSNGFNGPGVSEAVKWFRGAAEEGNAAAQLYMGNAFYRGQGVPQNYKLAVKWYRKAAMQGLFTAQENLGGCYASGKVPIEVCDENSDGNVIGEAVEVYKWVKLAAERGYEGALKTVAVIEALLSPEDFQEAERQYNEIKTKRQK